ncbi:MAG TPA: hypothetical protein VJR23_11235 [Candidatus Acidoferrales bacterium]|nr:hypothetical protein [Candidatus Acidoferrales bacterium]
MTRKIDRSGQAANRFSNPVRWTALIFLVFWLGVYWRYWGLANFLHLCDVAVILTCLGLWTSSALLISSQAVASLLIDLAWLTDAGWTVVTRHHLIGGTEYIFDASYPLWLRLLSLFHVVLPIVLLSALHHSGYDRRAWALESGIALVLYSATRFTSPEQNIGFAFTDPFFHHSWKPAPLHVALTVLFLMFVVFLPTHLLLGRIFHPAAHG